jgi:hypothetical protein
MPVIDLTRYIVAASGTWIDPSQDENLFSFTPADTRSADRLVLRWAGDFVALTGPLRISVTVQAENLTLPLAYVSNLVPDAAATYQPISNGLAGGTAKASINSGASLFEAALGRVGKGALSLQASTIYSYTLEISAGQAWPFSLSEQLDAMRLQGIRPSRLDQLGNNLGYRVIIEPAIAVSKLVPVNANSDLPCDFAVANLPDTSRFFPVACEPCEASVFGIPGSGTVSLITPPAEGGCVRTRFFNGMFITREDLETEQRYHRLKSKLHNRVMGAGVGWGFAVHRSGNSICVSPGYGVDCCGNDLTITSTYQVDIHALLADPAAAAFTRQRASHRLNLLLEYVECPSDHRPVHGDPCSPEASRCEISRIRESVRLRLVPPCDFNAATASAPLQHFLDEVRKLRAQYPLSTGLTSVGADRAPFQLRITVNGSGGNAPASNSVQVRPTAPGSTVTLPNPRDGVTSIAVQVLVDPLWTFVQGTLSGQGDSAASPVVDPATPVDLSLANGFTGGHQVTFTPPPGAFFTNGTLTFKLSNWQAQTFIEGQNDPGPAGDLALVIELRDRRIARATLTESPIAFRPINLAPRPCGTPCGTTTTINRGTVSTADCAGFDTSPASVFTANQDPFPVLPWLPTDPLNNSRAGDPKALAMAALASWLSQSMVREQVGTNNESTSTRREIAQGIYRIAWLLLFGVPQNADPAALGCSLHRLIEEWCDSLLWKGPQCCCDPHGVVIACVVVEAGDIRKIDQFGRRYVIHYPILEHWIAQAGFAPPDISLMRFFSTLCCVAGLPAAIVGQPKVGPFIQQLWGGWVGVGDPAEVAARFSDKTIVYQRRVSTAELIVAFIALIGTTTPQQPKYQQLVLADFVADQTVVLLTPAT